MQLNEYRFWASLKSKESTLLKEVKANINCNINVQPGITIGQKGFGPHKMNRYTIGRLVMCAIKAYCRDSGRVLFGYSFNAASIVECVCDVVKNSCSGIQYNIIPSHISKSMFANILTSDRNDPYSFGIYIASLYDGKIAVSIFDSNGLSSINLEPLYSNSSDINILKRNTEFTWMDDNIYMDYNSNINIYYCSNTAIAVKNIFDQSKKIKLNSSKNDIKIGLLASSGTIGAIFVRMFYMSGFRNIVCHPSAIAYTNDYQDQIDPSITPDKKTLEFFGNDVDVIFIINEDGTRVSMLIPSIRGNRKVLTHFKGQNMAYMISMLYLTMTDVTDVITILRSRTTTQAIDYLCNRNDSNITCIEKSKENISRIRRFDKSIYVSDTEEFSIIGALNIPDAISTALFIAHTINFFKDKNITIAEMYDKHMAKNTFFVSFSKTIEVPDGLKYHDFSHYLDKPLNVHNVRDMIGVRYNISDIGDKKISRNVSRDSSIVFDFDKCNNRIRICADILLQPYCGRYFTLDRYLNTKISNAIKPVRYKDIDTIEKAIQMVENAVWQIIDMV